jgi:hypothetical protein
MKRSVLSGCLLAIVGIGAGHAAAAAETKPAIEYLSREAFQQITSVKMGWGDFGRDTAVRPGGREPAPLQIKDQKYSFGLGHHAPGEIVVDLGGRYLTFEADIGVQWQGNSGVATIVFQVFVDGRKRFDSGVMRESDPPRKVSVSLAGAETLRLVAGDAGDGYACDCADWADARLVRDPKAPKRLVFDKLEATLAGRPAQVSSRSALGFFLLYSGSGPQAAAMPRARSLVAAVGPGEEARLRFPVRGLEQPARATATLSNSGSAAVDVAFGMAGRAAPERLAPNESRQVRVDMPAGADVATIEFVVRGAPGATEAAVCIEQLAIQTGNTRRVIPLVVAGADPQQCPPAELPPLRRPIEDALVEWDWRMQDGIGVETKPSTYAAAIEATLRRGDALRADLPAEGVDLKESAEPWRALSGRFRAMVAAKTPADAPAWVALWRDAHRLRRAMVLANPQWNTGPLAFAKQVPSCFSHQLTQYYGSCARPGGGLFVLEEPGRSMRCRSLTAGKLPLGSYQHLDVSYDGRRVMFAYCRAETTPRDRESNLNRFYRLYEIAGDGGGLRRLTDAEADDFAPRYLPDGRIAFISTRRGGFHRCGRGPCPVYALAIAEADGSRPRPISFHETHEWDPAVLGDGRLIYTRWDYVDRNAVHYQQLWSVRPDGSDVRIFYGNATLNPIGVWEARAVPGSRRIMATAAPHHGMTAGSIILVDPTRGVDGLDPLTRLTPDAPFPESEAPLAGSGPGAWYAPVGVKSPRPMPVEAERWPGHCYRTPLPLSEKYFIAAYSYDAQLGEPVANPANQFGLYLVDAFGNKELLYRDLNISSLWPSPLAPRARPTVLPSLAETGGPREGTFFMQNVYESWPRIENAKITRLRVVQVLPKSTWHANDPPLGLPSISPGKQVLGTVPVEPDGSAMFRAPAGIGLAFQALDANGEAVQVMRSLTYLQPGETVACVGCHEPRNRAPASPRPAMALARGPSTIQPGPEGSLPLSYPLLVQPVINRHCAHCHAPGKEAAKWDLTGRPEGHYTASYNVLAPRVSYSDWSGKLGDFRIVNSEPLTSPGFFGIKGSALGKLLHKGHYDVKMPREDWERLATWMDANGLFYGTFDPADQARQRRGERIAGPKIQ